MYTLYVKEALRGIYLGGIWITVRVFIGKNAYILVDVITCKGAVPSILLCISTSQHSPKLYNKSTL